MTKAITEEDIKLVKEKLEALNEVLKPIVMNGIKITITSPSGFNLQNGGSKLYKDATIELSTEINPYHKD